MGTPTFYYRHLCGVVDAQYNDLGNSHVFDSIRELSKLALNGGRLQYALCVRKLTMCEFAMFEFECLSIINV